MRAKRFLACRRLEDLALLLCKPALKLLSLSEFPTYNEFTLPKKSGGHRLIEDPTKELKKVQRKLNDYLQAVYYFNRSNAAYGFLTNPVDDPSPRHILSNAQIHIGCRWLINMDMKDFFHFISEDRVRQVFEIPVFDFKESISKVLAGLCCYKGRLPMGAPTSPILSNFATLGLDRDLEAYALNHSMSYTRYADDMTFSSKAAISQEHFREIEKLINTHQFQVNPGKVKHYGPDQADKEVTGLWVRDNRIDLPDEYLAQLTLAIDRLDEIIDDKFSTLSGRGQPTLWLEEWEQQIRGKLEFARQILGEEDLLYLDLALRLEEALMPPENFGPMNWLDFGYLPPK